jgi:acetolactate synthase-1/2/3 large subunit
MAADSSVARTFARSLRAAGVRRVYGLPGEDHLRLLDALADEGVVYVGARDESAAAIMAAAEAQATGVPGVVLVTLAPGITNAINGIAHAWLDGIPLLIVTGQHDPERAPVIVRQSLDTHQIVSGVVKWNVRASQRISQTLAKALDTALAPRPGPVLFELRDDVASAPALDASEDWPVLQLGAHTQATIGSASVPRDVARARRPVLVVGGNCPFSSRDVLALAAERLAAPVFTSPAAMGILPSDSPWSAGTFMNGNLETFLLDRADLIITIGLDAKDFFNAAWRYSAPVLALNPYPDTQRFAPATHQLVGDCAAGLVALANAGSSSEWTIEDVREYHAHVRAPFDLESRAFTIPAALCTARAVLPADALVTVDAGFGKPLTSYLWSAAGPNQYFTAHGLSTMGFALPAANALQIAYPLRPVVGFMGDGSLLMRASEISVAAEHGVAPILIGWLDGALAQIETKQLRQRLNPVGARLPSVSCAKIADAFGGSGCDVASIDEFRDALEMALDSRVPTLIGARVDQSRRAEWYELMRG